jgi:hypothetical protein
VEHLLTAGFCRIGSDTFKVALNVRKRWEREMRRLESRNIARLHRELGIAEHLKGVEATDGPHSQEQVAILEDVVEVAG